MIIKQHFLASEVRFRQELMEILNFHTIQPKTMLQSIIEREAQIKLAIRILRKHLQRVKRRIKSHNVTPSIYDYELLQRLDNARYYVRRVETSFRRLQKVEKWDSQKRNKNTTFEPL
jgi:hypothetical protein